ncbi:MAG: hypothetical protein ACD_58C00092G0002 [uncultured bacterium]|nr:MAG: hypothetical protein ACD_58C00092G0002 [uncultured bacterium]
MLLTKTNNLDAGIRKRTISREIKIGPLSLQFITVIIFAALALLYLAQSTQSASKNYKVRELTDKKIELEQENERLQIESTRLKSLNGIKEKTDEMQLQSNNTSNYLPDNATYVRR